jgi:hypothetical protein
MRRIAVVVLLSTLTVGGLVLSQRAEGTDDRAVHAIPTTTDAPTTTDPPPPTSETTEPSGASSVPALPLDYVAWTKVAICEEGGWIGASGAAYPDSLGIKAANWYRFGGGMDVSPAAQIAVADRLIAFYDVGVPDQHGCAGSW